MKNVTVIGLGVMGAALARVLLKNGFDVTAWNRSREKAEPLKNEGATIANSFAEAISVNATIIVCIKTHTDTKSLLETAPSLEGKNIIELSTGSAPEAESLYQWLRKEQATCLIGMICTFPRAIGEEDSTILTVGSAALWKRSKETIKILAGKSTYLGTQVSSLAILYSALFLPGKGLCSE